MSLLSSFAILYEFGFSMYPQFAEMCLGHVVTSSSSPPPSLYHLLAARLHLHRGHYSQARDCLTSALQTDIQVYTYTVCSIYSGCLNRGQTRTVIYLFFLSFFSPNFTPIFRFFPPMLLQTLLFPQSLLAFWMNVILKLPLQSSWAWSLLGHTHYQLGEFPEAQQAFERCLLLQTPPPNQHSALLHLAHILYNEKKVCLIVFCYIIILFIHV